MVATIFTYLTISCRLLSFMCGQRASPKQGSVFHAWGITYECFIILQIQKSESLLFRLKGYKWLKEDWGYCHYFPSPNLYRLQLSTLHPVMWYREGKQSVKTLPLANYSISLQALQQIPLKNPSKKEGQHTGSSHNIK